MINYDCIYLLCWCPFGSVKHAYAGRVSRACKPTGKVISGLYSVPS